MLRADALRETDGERFLGSLRRQAQALIPAGSRIIGPLPSTMPRRAGRFRWQIWCLSQSRQDAVAAAQSLVAQASEMKQPRGLNWFIDVDPVDVL